MDPMMSARIMHKTHSHWRPLPGAAAQAEARADLEAYRRDLRKMAHDLRNPLNSILLMAQLLEETGGSPDATRIAQRIQRQCSEMNGLVDKALNRVPE
jgi:signal transduction histidine kinase